MKYIFALLTMAMLLISIAAPAQILDQATPIPENTVVTVGPRIAATEYDYDNTVNDKLNYYVGNNAIVLDDITRTTSADIAAITFGYYIDAPIASLDANLFVYGMDINTGDVTDLLGAYSLTELPVGAWIFEVDLPTPLAAPQDLYIGMQFSNPNAGLMIYDPPVVGYSLDYFAKSTDGGNTWSYVYFGGEPKANFCLATRPVPEPGSLMALGGGLMGLLALRRRR
ncbi:MAG TPA: PEP-CTERM sorting domain-containing protein [Armatimonadota bacterium]|nr:PEP-CTERM sorting domain-containing protein [Armatimonadota bacterium]HOM71359.1 PEP-CTERM sorting domain-containing protein [Armatimonadota bacterium]HPP75433.1 PEP-CTERM sorting domain-containing protein [Armatimonadota bacterium]